MNLSEKTDWEVICDTLDGEFGIAELRTIASSIGIAVSGKSKKDICSLLAEDYIKHTSSHTSGTTERKCHDENSLTDEPFSDMPDSEVVQVVEGNTTYCFTVDEILSLKGTNPFTRTQFPRSVLDEATEKKNRRGAIDPRSVVHKRQPRLNKQVTQAQAKLKELLDGMNVPRNQIDSLTSSSLLRLTHYLSPRIPTIDGETWRQVLQTYGKNRDEGLLLLFTTLLEKADKTFTETLVADFFAQERSDPTTRWDEFLRVVEFGSVEEVQAFINSGIDPSKEDSEALSVATNNENLGVLKLLLADERVLVKDDILFYASLAGETDLVRRLLNERTFPDDVYNDSLEEACRNRHTDIVELLLKTDKINNDGITEALYSSVPSYRHIEIVKMLLKDKRVESDGWPSLIFRPIMVNNVEMVKVLLEDGRTNIDGALERAALYGRNEIVYELLVDGRTIPVQRDVTTAKTNRQTVIACMLKARLATKKEFARHPKTKQITEVLKPRVIKTTDYSFRGYKTYKYELVGVASDGQKLRTTVPEEYVKQRKIKIAKK